MKTDNCLNKILVQKENVANIDSAQEREKNLRKNEC